MAQGADRQSERRVVALRHEGEDAAARLPALLAEADRIAATVAQGVHGRRRSGIGETFWQYRHHRPEDGRAAVDWRQSAKSDQLFVRQNEWEAANTVSLWRDASASMQFASNRNLPSKADRAAVCLIAVAALPVAAPAQNEPAENKKMRFPLQRNQITCTPVAQAPVAH